MPGIVQTSLSPETSIRNGFDVFMAPTELTRRNAVDLMRLAEEAGVRIGVSRWLRRAVAPIEPARLVTLVANPAFELSDLVDLAMWMTKTRGPFRMESEMTGDSFSMTLCGPTGSMISIHVTPGVSDLRIFVDGPQGERSIALDPPDGIGCVSELLLFSAGSAESVSLEDSLDVISILERARTLVR